MPHVQICNVSSRVIGVDPRRLQLMSDGFAVSPAKSFWMRRGGWDGKIRLVRRDGRFPTGLLARVTDWLEADGTPIRLIDRRPPAPSREHGGTAVVLRPHQVEPAEAAIACRRGILKAATNFGKTETAIHITARLNVRTLYLVPTVDLAEQTAARFAAGLPRTRVARAVAGEALPEADVVIGNVQAVSHLVRLAVKRRNAKTLRTSVTLGPVTSDGRAWLESFGLVFLDECHLLSSDEWVKIPDAMAAARHRFALSATPETGDAARDLRLNGIAGEIIGGASQQDLAAAGISARITVTVLGYRAGPPMASGEWDEQLDQGIVRADGRNTAAATTAVAEWQVHGHRSMILVDRYEHAARIGAVLTHFGIGWRFLSGKSKATRAGDLADFRAGRTPVIIGTRVLNQGISVDEIDALIIAAAGKSANLTVQRAGRLVRTRPDKAEATLYDFDDGQAGLYAASVPPWQRHLGRHFRARLAAYRSEGFLIADRKAS